MSGSREWWPPSGDTAGVSLALLEAKNLAPALEACREAAREKLEEINSINDLATDVSVALQMMRILDDQITS